MASGVICQIIQEYLLEFEAIIKLSPKFIPLKIHLNDMTILDVIFDYDHSFDDIQIKQTDSCQIYLGVTYLSEICNVKRTHLFHGIGGGEISNLEYITTQEKFINQTQQPIVELYGIVCFSMLLIQNLMN